MKHYLWIPAIATLASLIVIWLAHPAPAGEKDETDSTPAKTSDEESADSRESEEKDDPPAPPAADEFKLILMEDGSIQDEAGDRTFKDVAEVLDQLAPPDKPRPRITFSNNSVKVSEEAFDKATAELRKRCDLTKRYYRAPKEDGDK